MIVQPLEFLKFTARNNCGKCGYAACLAFAVAVTKGGEDPGKCPFVDLQALGPDFAAGDRGRDGLSGVAGLGDEQDKALVSHLQGKVRGLDFAVLAPQLGCQWSGLPDDSLQFRYLGRPVSLSVTGVFFGEPGEVIVEDPRDQILLYNFVFFGGGEPLTGEWVGMESLPNSISKVRTLRVYCEERIASHFSGKAEQLRACGGRIDAVPVQDDQTRGCSVAWQVLILPRLPALLLFWDEEPEEGFPARVKILYDRQVLSVLDLESLVFASERLAERLVEVSFQIQS